jgi:UDP-2-acetamido-2,6-beta-L-arabino-hexul-4-ose reductase
MKKILVTGANGFIGKNLVAELRNRRYEDIFETDVDTEPELLEEYCRHADFVFHFAGINRPQHVEEFDKGNRGLTADLLALLEQSGKKIPIIITSSTQAVLDNPYGVSKKAAEDAVFDWARRNSAPAYVYRLPNVFGKWCRPNYNSVVATFCHNIAHGLPIQINNPATELTLVYIDDVVTELIAALNGLPLTGKDGFCYVPRIFKVSLQQLADAISAFAESRKNLIIPNFEGDFAKFLYATYTSYLPEHSFGYELEKKHDQRGWLAEFIKSRQFGQIFISRTKPGITRGNHWHHTKIEKFLVIEGEAAVKLRKIGTGQVLEYKVSGEQLQVLDIPAGYTHSITNTSQTDLVTLIWANEIFDQKKPDTFFLEV